MNFLKVAVKNPDSTFSKVAESLENFIVKNEEGRISIEMAPDEFGFTNLPLDLLQTEFLENEENLKNLVVVGTYQGEKFALDFQGTTPLKVLSITHPSKPYAWLDAENFDGKPIEHSNINIV